MSYRAIKGDILNVIVKTIYNLMGVGAGGQGVEPPVRVWEKLAQNMVGI
jgi:hypothetical protein